MAFGQNSYNNSGDNKRNCNTTGFQLYTKSGKLMSTLVCGFWNETLTVKICPALPENMRGEKKVYDYETFITTALTLEKAIALQMGLDKIKEQVIDGNYDFINFGVALGAGYLEISNGVSEGIDNTIILTLYSKINERGIPEKSLKYCFNKVNLFKGYNPAEGQFDRTEVMEAEFILFTKFINTGVEALLNAHAHSMRNVNKYADNRHNDNVKSIMEKLGISTSPNGGYSKGGNSGNGFFTNGSRGVQNNQNNNSSSEEIPFDGYDSQRISSMDSLPGM